MDTVHARAPLGASPWRAWRGEAPLGLVFWGYGVLLSLVLIAAYVAALAAGAAAAQQGLLVVFWAYTAWVLVSVWRCAEQAQGSWGLIARLLTVAWVGNTVLVTGFLQLRLFEA